MRWIDRITPERQAELDKHVAAIVEMDDVSSLVTSESVALVSCLARAAVGLSPEIDIADLGETERNEVLSIMRGIRDTLHPRARSLGPTAGQLQAENLTANVPPAQIAHFVK